MKLPGMSPDLSSDHEPGTPEWWVEKWTRLESVVLTNRRLMVGLFAVVAGAVLGDIDGAREMIGQLLAGG